MTSVFFWFLLHFLFAPNTVFSTICGAPAGSSRRLGVWLDVSHQYSCRRTQTWRRLSLLSAAAMGSVTATATVSRRDNFENGEGDFEGQHVESFSPGSCSIRTRTLHRHERRFLPPSLGRWDLSAALLPLYLPRCEARAALRFTSRRQGDGKKCCTLCILENANTDEERQGEEVVQKRIRRVVDTGFVDTRLGESPTMLRLRQRGDSCKDQNSSACPGSDETRVFDIEVEADGDPLKPVSMTRGAFGRERPKIASGAKFP